MQICTAIIEEIQSSYSKFCLAKFAVLEKMSDLNKKDIFSVINEFGAKNTNKCYSTSSTSTNFVCKE